MNSERSGDNDRRVSVEALRYEWEKVQSEGRRAQDNIGGKKGRRGDRGKRR
jgi:hypothetical protein